MLHGQSFVEIGKLVALYIQPNLDIVLPNTKFRLNRNDGLVRSRNLNGHQLDQKRKLS